MASRFWALDLLKKCKVGSGMDDNSGNTTDKRNWRERLGIGKTAGSAHLPKLSPDFKPIDSEPAKVVQAAATSAKSTATKPATHTPVKVAPMAPRPAVRPAASAAGTAKAAAPLPTTKSAAVPAPAAPIAAAPARAPAPRTPPLPTDALANKLKDQREAAERLALQRVQAAKNKAEATLNAGGATAKPKFSFADDSRQASAALPASPSAAAPQAPRPAAPSAFGPQSVPQNPFGTQPSSSQLQPPRPQLGGGSFGVPPSFSQQGQSYMPPGSQPQSPFQSNYGYQQPPPYRPIDPKTGYVPPSGQPYLPPSARQPFHPSMPPAGQRRPSQPIRGSVAPLPDPRGASISRGPQIGLGSALGSAPDSDDVFEPAPVRSGTRRATANEYQQAYRDELGYEEEAPRARGLGTLLALLMLVLLVAFGAVYVYANYFKIQHAATANNAVPVVTAPTTPTKTTPDASTAQDLIGKKQIYDRIEGDHEVSGGPLKASEETPAIQPGAVQGDKVMTPAGQPAKGTNGTDGTPLPLPPPPGSGTGQQGSLAPDGKTDVANITPAAEQSSAANLSTTPADPTPVASQTVAPPADDQLPLPIPEPPVSPQSSKSALQVSQPSQLATADDAAKPTTEAVAPVKPATAKPTALASSTVEPTPTTNKSKNPDALKKLVLGKSLGSKPVVLVAPDKAAATATTKIASAAPEPINSTGGNGLYGDAPNPVQPPTAAKPIGTVAAVQAAPATPPVAAPTGNAFVVQLATFNSKSEANAAYQRLSAKHGAIVTRYAPIIAQADIAGSTRYKLNLGPIPSNEAASSVCSALISAGKREVMFL